MAYWISKTHVRIEPNEMTHEDAVEMARDLLIELVANSGPRRRGHVQWTPEKDERLRILRSQGVAIRSIATELFGAPDYVGAVSGRIRRLGLPIDEFAKRRGLASAAAQRKQ